MKARRCIEVMIASPGAHRVLRPEDILDLAICPYGGATVRAFPAEGRSISLYPCSTGTRRCSLARADQEFRREPRQGYT